MASGWNLWVLLVGVARVDIFIIIITFPTPLVLGFFWQQHRYPYFFVHFKNVFSFFIIYSQ